MKTSNIAVRLPEDDRRLIDEAAKATGTTISGFMRHWSCVKAKQVLREAAEGKPDFSTWEADQ